MCGCSREQVLSLVVQHFDKPSLEDPYEPVVTTAIFHLIPQAFTAVEIVNAISKATESDLQVPLSVLVNGCLWQNVSRQKAIVEELLAHPVLRADFFDGVHKLRIDEEVFDNLAQESEEWLKEMEIMFMPRS
jgi:hypothetical protein